METIDLSELSFDDAVQKLVELTGMDEADAIMQIAIERGLSDGDLVETDDEPA